MDMTTYYTDISLFDTQETYKHCCCWLLDLQWKDDTKVGKVAAVGIKDISGVSTTATSPDDQECFEELVN